MLSIDAHRAVHRCIRGVRSCVAPRDACWPRAKMPCVRQFYASDSTYVWQDASGQSHEVRQSEGSEPGDPLMPALYAIAQHAALAAVHAQLREGEAVFPYPDDINVSQFSSASGNCRTPANGHFASTRALNSTVAKPASGTQRGRSALTSPYLDRGLVSATRPLRPSRSRHAAGCRRVRPRDP